MIDSKGEKFEPNILRLGKSDSVNQQVRDVTLEEILDKKFGKPSRDNDKDTLRNEQQQINDRIKELKEILHDTAISSFISEEEKKKSSEELRSLTHRSKNLRSEKDTLKNEQQQINDRIKELKEILHDTAISSFISEEEKKKSSEELRSLTYRSKNLWSEIEIQREKKRNERRDYMNTILREAHIICSTLSGSANAALASIELTFDTVIIDEAAQCVELSSLIPLCYGCRKCIMVGDPKQLPPTVLSQTACNLNYDQSLFVRMFDQYPEMSHLLNTQFRMHPDIAQFPSDEFYKGKIYSGDLMADITANVWHSNPRLSPYKFFDVAGHQKNSKETKSLYNSEEAEFACELFQKLLKECKEQGKDLKLAVGIISPYKRQVKELKSVFRKNITDDIFKQIAFKTVDGFQGQEKDVVILSCVRASPYSQSVGFLGDTRRMNVSITRAKSSMWILGNEESLVKNDVWRRLINDAKERKMFEQANGSEDKIRLYRKERRAARRIGNNRVVRADEGVDEDESKLVRESVDSKAEGPESYNQ